jgi:hypothetical protein
MISGARASMNNSRLPDDQKIIAAPTPSSERHDNT